MTSHYINGVFCEGKSETAFSIYNPTEGKVLKKIKFANDDQIYETIAKAKHAFESWSATPPLKRARHFFTLKNLIEESKQELAELVSKEHGKLVPDALGSIQRGLEIVEYACAIPELLKGNYSENVSSGIDSYSIRQPLGVCIGITPFNFPVMIPLWLSVMSIACGNTFILKPSEQTPSASLFIAKLFEKAGFPKGVFNVLQGDKNTVEKLIIAEDVKAVSFVGSSAIAHDVYKLSSNHGKRCQALGSGKNHLVVMPDANIDQVTEALVGSAYGSAGERCMAISVAIAVTDAVADSLVKKLKSRITQIKLGTGSDNQAEMGPLVTEKHYNRVSNYIEKGIEEGAALISDGRSLSHPTYKNGYFMGATLFDHVKPSMSIYQDEIFGPVLAIVRADTYQEALKLVTDHPFGNGASIFTQNGSIAHHFSHHAPIGMIGVNVPIPVPAAFHSFGGWKKSLFGDHNVYGNESIRFYTRIKTITTRWTGQENESAAFHMPKTA